MSAEDFKGANIEGMRAFLTDVNYYLPSKDSVAGKNKTFLLGLYEKRFTALGPADVLACPYDFEVSVGLTPIAAMLQLAVCQNLRMEELPYHYGFGEDMLPDTTYLMYLIWKKNPANMAVTLYAMFKRNNLPIDYEIAQSNLLYRDNALNRQMVNVALPEKEKRLVDMLNKAGEAYWMCSVDFQGIHKLIGTGIKLCKKHPELAVFDRDVLDKLYLDGASLYNAYKKFQMAEQKTTAERLQRHK